MEKITITAKDQIVATDTDKVLLNKTMSVYCDACNYVSDYVFRTHDLKPVSYTHLDVYKRQITERVLSVMWNGS